MQDDLVQLRQAVLKRSPPKNAPKGRTKPSPQQMNGIVAPNSLYNKQMS